MRRMEVWQCWRKSSTRAQMHSWWLYFAEARRILILKRIVCQMRRCLFRDNTLVVSSPAPTVATTDTFNPLHLITPKQDTYHVNHRPNFILASKLCWLLPDSLLTRMLPGCQQAANKLSRDSLFLLKQIFASQRTKILTLTQKSQKWIPAKVFKWLSRGSQEADACISLSSLTISIFWNHCLFARRRCRFISIRYPSFVSFSLLFSFLSFFFYKSKKTKQEQNKNGTTTKHPQMTASKQIPLWLFWDV